MVGFVLIAITQNILNMPLTSGKAVIKGRSTLFNRFIYIRKGDYLKYRECVNMLYDEIDEGE